MIVNRGLFESDQVCRERKKERERQGGRMNDRGALRAVLLYIHKGFVCMRYRIRRSQGRGIG